MSGVPPSALYTALQSAVDGDSALPSNTGVDTVLGSWVDNAGYPVVTVLRNYESNTATLSQVCHGIILPSRGSTG